MSTQTSSETRTVRGGEFLTKNTLPEDIFIPEQFTEEQLMIAQSCRDFLAQEVFPFQQRIEAMEHGLMQSILNKAGALGLLSISVPEQYGGFGKDFTTSMIATEVLGAGHSF